MDALSLKFVVPFDEADKEGIVFFGNYFRLAHRALEHYLPGIGIPWTEWFENPEFGVPLRHAEADYLKPLKAGEEYSVRVLIMELGESSVHFIFEFSNNENVLAARIKTTHVFVNRSPLKKMPVPVTIAERLKAAQS